jgi:aconitate hydratase
MPATLDKARRRFGRALTLAEKILVSHADNFDTQQWSRGKAQLRAVLAQEETEAKSKVVPFRGAQGGKQS